MNEACLRCHTVTIDKLIAKFRPDSPIAESLKSELLELMDEHPEESNPSLAGKIHRLARKKLNHSDLYAEEKLRANIQVLSNYSWWESLIERAERPCHMAAILAAVGNVIDFGAGTASEDVTAQVWALSKRKPAINDIGALLKEIKKARKVLYLGDNAGEIVFDRLFIETVGTRNVTYVVRSNPVINDVTLEDARHCRMEQLCQVISNGDDSPSTLLDRCTPEFRERFREADLVISKGQGNFEGLMHNPHPNLFFMLMAKCDPIAELLNVNRMDLVITHWKRTEHELSNHHRQR